MFNEITKKAILEAVKHPGEIDMRMVDAQQARRVLDRLVGYKISPILWDKVRRGLSAGRVQSVALKLICDREREIEAFVAEEYWHITARLAGANPPEFDARLLRKGDAAVKIGNERERERDSRRSRARHVHGVVDRDQGASPSRGAAVHHEQAAAGGTIPRQEDDDGGAATVRGDSAAERRRAGRSHYLHAY